MYGESLSQKFNLIGLYFSTVRGRACRNLGADTGPWF
jgi:hypothetical protein